MQIQTFDTASRATPSKIFRFLFHLKKFQNNFIATLAFENVKLNEVAFRKEVSLQHEILKHMNMLTEDMIYF